MPATPRHYPVRLLQAQRKIVAERRATNENGNTSDDYLADDPTNSLEAVRAEAAGNSNTVA
jgi:hypothetical protein